MGVAFFPEIGPSLRVTFENQIFKRVRILPLLHIPLSHVSDSTFLLPKVKSEVSFESWKVLKVGILVLKSSVKPTSYLLTNNFQ